ncbi:hypothetical protein ANCCAN_30553 [Ancylostoma caninum]|uniref:Phorbol-ester/DAG-type domain-containing protein n=1 Tax=Ancylostoma caninum TaxID=29170 RepID=A0A368EYA4_ANCCA|nr:hypothetical protein ANCCAN_30553 [Ancylostoma caninum]
MFDDRDNGSRSRNASANDLSITSVSRRDATWKNHDFQELTFHVSTYCDICHKICQACYDQRPLMSARILLFGNGCLWR